MASTDIELFPEEVRTLLSDKDTLMGAVSLAHDTRVSKLDAKEDELRQAQTPPPLRHTLQRLGIGVVGRPFFTRSARCTRYSFHWLPPLHSTRWD